MADKLKNIKPKKSVLPEILLVHLEVRQLTSDDFVQRQKMVECNGEPPPVKSKEWGCCNTVRVLKLLWGR